MNGLFDVRSPCEYAHAHIPGAINLPLFSDEERKIIGTLYKQEGSEQAIERGLEFVGPKLADFVKKAKKLPSPITVYCARGGMRSEAMQRLFSFAGIPSRRLEGGYKTYRQQVLATFQKPWKLLVISGLTGCGKTEFIRNSGKPAIDLEELARHRGSAFGWLGAQPSTEHFENLLAEKLNQCDPDLPILVENESRLSAPVKYRTPFFFRCGRLRVKFWKSPLKSGWKGCFKNTAQRRKKC